MATVNKTAPSQEKKIMNTTAFDQIKTTLVPPSKS